jgi:hypothetical protein
MKMTAFRIPAFALSAALAAGACGGAEEKPPAAQSPGAAQVRAAKPKRMEPLPAPSSEARPARPAPAPVVPQSPPLPELASPDMPLPEGEQVISNLPDDVPVPRGARSLAPVLVSPDGVAHGTFELPVSVASAATTYTAGLLQEGWSTEPVKTLGNQALINATKGDRQVTIAIEGSGDRSQIVIVEMQRPPG